VTPSPVEATPPPVTEPTPSPTPAPISAAPPPTAGECFDDGDCSIGETCVNGSCVSDFGFE
jgi:hypothetical protein